MIDRSFTYHADDASLIYVHGWAPENPPKGVLQIIHGMAEHGGRYQEVAQFFVKNGFAVYAHDQRGCGKSIAQKSDLGHVADEDSFMTMVNDAHSINRSIAATHARLPIILLGHSLGSFIAQTILFMYPNDCVACALSGSSGQPPLIAKAGRIVARVERARLGKRGKSRLLRRLSFDDFNRRFKPNRTHYDWLSRDENEVDAYLCDPFCGFDVSTQTWVDLLDALSTIVHVPDNQKKIQKDKPIYIFSGTNDPVGDMGKGPVKLHHAYEQAGLQNLSFKLYSGGRHEMLHEINRTEVFENLLSFVQSSLSSRS